MSDLRTAAQQALEALPVAGKVVAWGVFAVIDGEWQLQHPVFVGDEQGKASAEFERASYSGPQPLEVRPLGVVTATAQQAEPVYWEVRCTAHPKWMRVDKQQFDEYVAHGWEGQRLYTAPPQQAEPVAWRWGYRSVTTGEMDWRGYVEIAAHPNLRSPEIIIEPLYTAPPKDEPKPMHPELRKMWEDHFDKCFRAIPVPEQAEPVEPVAWLIAQRDALLEALKLARPYINPNTPYGYYAEVKADAAIKAVEEGK